MVLYDLRGRFRNNSYRFSDLPSILCFDGTRWPDVKLVSDQIT